MSSPAASASGGDRAKKPLEQITFRFCSECSNMLYPKEDEQEHKLMFMCRTCNFAEEAASSCISRNLLNSAAGETAGVTQDVSSDPTVGGSSPVLSSTSSTSTRSSIGPGTPNSTASSSYVCCLQCGGMILCQACGQRHAVLPRDKGIRGLEPEETWCLECEDVNVRPWTDSPDDLAAYVGCTTGFFGDWIYDEADEYMEEDEPAHENPGTTDQHLAVALGVAKAAA